MKTTNLPIQYILEDPDITDRKKIRKQFPQKHNIEKNRSGHPTEIIAFTGMSIQVGRPNIF